MSKKKRKNIGNREIKITKPWQALLCSLLFIAISMIAFWASKESMKEYNEKSSFFIKSTGRVVGYDDKDSDHIKDYDEEYYYEDNGEYVTEIIEYEVDGKKYEIISNRYSNDPKPIGSKIKIKYNPNQPDDAILALDISHYIGMIISGFFVLIGCAIFFISGKKMLKGE